MSESWGTSVERDALTTAAVLGVPDFVYHPALEHTGKKNREVSDGLLICGDDGVILQVESRLPASAESDDAEAAQRWIRKNAEDGRKQADGTRRRLGRSDPIEFESVRGYRRRLTGVEDWPGVVIVDHPATPEGIVLPHHPNTMWITRSDWFALHEYLRSTASVIAYVQRAVSSGLQPPLNQEYGRYLRLAEADAKALGGPASLPLLPLDPIDPDDEPYAAIVDDLINQVWPNEGPIRWESSDDYRRIVELLDRILPAARPLLGRKIVSTIAESEAARDRRSFFTKIQARGQAQICFLAADVDRYEGGGGPEERAIAELLALTETRHAQARRNGPRPLGPTLGIGRLADAALGVAYSFVLVEPDRYSPPPDLQWAVASEYGVLHRDRITPVEATGRNEPCPCGSGRKSKVCHLR